MNEPESQVEYGKNERFRELCCMGDLMLVRNAYANEQPDVNSQNKINGWTALHWAVKRSHAGVVKYLLEIGASTQVANKDGKTPLAYVKDTNTASLFGMTLSADQLSQNESNTRKPAYLSHPEFHYANNSLYARYGDTPSDQPATKKATTHTADHQLISRVESTATATANPEKAINKASKPTSPPQVVANAVTTTSENQASIITVRVRASTDDDFIELDVDKRTTSFDAFKAMCCRELERPAASVSKIRKLPNLLVRNDRDIQRLVHEQHVELVFSVTNE